MASSPSIFPPAVVRAFVKRMNDYFSETEPLKRDTIAVLQLRDLESHRKGKLRLDDVRPLFAEMRAHLEQ
ncbi:conserved hypothetical protein [Bradyrhizobium sp. STM 3843]|uniref:hypothetical protein n=1 Tax=Bradyrhizobium sp. STM 3843 TaxID=551947 RepID=UPI000240B077|nr:hypothetical protein [Bradyrhizobium sp. STM 3843]CCE07052.1 conserved hypothetical protein [Bradyrhizobium sp. STM 3843]